MSAHESDLDSDLGEIPGISIVGTRDGSNGVNSSSSNNSTQRFAKNDIHNDTHNTTHNAVQSSVPANHWYQLECDREGYVRTISALVCVIFITAIFMSLFSMAISVLDDYSVEYVDRMECDYLILNTTSSPTVYMIWKDSPPVQCETHGPLNIIGDDKVLCYRWLGSEPMCAETELDKPKFSSFSEAFFDEIKFLLIPIGIIGGLVCLIWIVRYLLLWVCEQMRA